MFPEVKIINGPSGVVLGKSGELLLVQVGWVKFISSFGYRVTS